MLPPPGATPLRQTLDVSGLASGRARTPPPVHRHCHSGGGVGAGPAHVETGAGSTTHGMGTAPLPPPPAPPAGIPVYDGGGERQPGAAAKGGNPARAPTNRGGRAHATTDALWARSRAGDESNERTHGPSRGFPCPQPHTHKGHRLQQVPYIGVGPSAAAPPPTKFLQHSKSRAGSRPTHRRRRVAQIGSFVLATYAMYPKGRWLWDGKGGRGVCEERRGHPPQ